MRLAGDEGLQDFCRAEYPQLVRVLTLHTGDVQLAQELAQEALVRACARWEQVCQMAAPGAWVHRVGINLANSWFRRRLAERRARLRHGTSDVHSDPDTAATLAVREAVTRLPERQRTVLVLRYYLDMSVADTAGVLGISEAAVRQHTSRAVAALRPRFGAGDSLGEQGAHHG